MGGYGHRARARDPKLDVEIGSHPIRVKSGHPFVQGVLAILGITFRVGSTFRFLGHIKGTLRARVW